MSMTWLSQLLIPDAVSKLLYSDLKKAVEKNIIPILEKKGLSLEAHPKYLPKPTYREKSCNPHGIFRRRKSGQDDILEIIYDDRRYPEFHLNFGIVPHEGVMVWGEPFPYEKMGVAESPVTYSLSSSQRSLRPFAIVWPLMSAKDIPKIVSIAEQVLPQVFDWFDTRNVGPNFFGGLNDPVSEIADQTRG